MSAEIRLVDVVKRHVGVASMGPRSDERGNYPEMPMAVAKVYASMGPRSDERGNLSTGHERSKKGLLQWGRALMSAEIVPIGGGSAGTPALQWGRALMSAEMRIRTRAPSTSM